MRKLIILLLSALAALTIAPAVYAQTPAKPDGAQYRFVEVVSGFNRPLFVTHAGDGSGRLFIVEQDGPIYIFAKGERLQTPFLDLTDLVSRSANERGLLGLAFHPKYKDNGLFFVNYTDKNGDTIIERYKVSASDPNTANDRSGTPIIKIDQPYANHNGGDVVFGPDGYLYIGMGDGGSAGDPQNNGQNPKALLGKMLRLDVNNADGKPYAVPPDNPFVGDARFAPEIWALGLRNPWRSSFDRQTGDFYIADVGQNAWEEVNFQPASSKGGENYGWNYLEGTHRYANAQNPRDLVMPFAEYNHGQGCSITGGYVYRGPSLKPLQGVYLFGDYCSGLVWGSYRDAAGNWQTTEFKQTEYTISSFGEDEAGEVYLVDHGGAVLRLATNGG
jgi:glucose/arabinose dehydrogenase